MKNILEAMADEQLFGDWFKRGFLRGDTWKAWRAFLAALFALPLDADALELYRKHTGRDDVPHEQANETWLICGRRSGKSLIAALIAVYLACFRDYSDILAPGEVGTVMVIASDKRQARVILGYVKGFFDSIKMLTAMVDSQTADAVTLTNRVRIEVQTASFRAVRGYTVIAAILDEIAFFPCGDAADPDEAIVNALRPAMATVPGALLLGISSPYSKRGVLWEVFRKHFGKADAPALVWKAATREMNPTVSKVTIAMAYARDAAAAAAEYGAEFRNDVSGFLALEVVEACVRTGRRELPPLSGTSYFAFCDPSGGQSDSFTLGIAHAENERAILDVLREAQPPFSPENVTAEFCELLKRYKVYQIEGDRYAGEWPREQFAKRGVSYEPAEQNKSEIFLEVLPLFMASQIELLDNARLVAQFVGLERRTARGGHDSIDHSPGSHDDLANAAAGALLRASRRAGMFGLTEYHMKLLRGEIKIPAPEEQPQFQREIEQQLAAYRRRGRALRPANTPAPPLPPCENCGSNLMQRVSGSVRCAQCGHQKTEGVYTQVTRGRYGPEYIERKFETNEKVAERPHSSPLRNLLGRWGRGAK